MATDDEHVAPWSRRLAERRVDRDYSYAEVAHRLRTLSRQQEGSDCGVTARTVWRWEHGTHPLARYRRLLCALYDATPTQLGFRLALPGENGHHEDVDRREFLAGATGLVASLALPEPPRLGIADLVRLRQSVTHLYELDNLHGAGGALTSRTFHRLRALVERGAYNSATGQGLRELVG